MSGTPDNGGTLDTEGAGLAADAGLTIHDAAERAGVSERTIRRALKAPANDPHHLPSWRVRGPRGREYRIAGVALDLWQGGRDALDLDARSDEDADDDGAETGQIGNNGTPDSRARPARPARLAAVDSPARRLADVSTVIEQAIQTAVTPLVEELARLNDLTRDQAEALGRERATKEALQAQLSALERRRARRRHWILRLLVGG